MSEKFEKIKFSHGMLRCIGGNQIKLLENDLGLKEGTFRKHLKKIHDKVLESKDSVAERICQTFPKAKIPLRISSLITDRSKSLKLQGAL